METRYVRNERELRYALMQIGATTEPLPGLPVEVGGVRIDWAKPSVVDALKRLERAGSEHSRTTEKLIQAADQLADYIIETALIPLERNAPYTGDVIADLPRAYYAVGPRRIVLGGYVLEPQDSSVGSGTATRMSALAFAQDIATGWLEELSSWLEQRAAEDEAAAETIEQAERG